MTLARRRPLRARGRGPRANFTVFPKDAPECAQCRRHPATVLRWCRPCAEKVADHRVGKFVKARDGACVACGSKRDLTWAHLLGRRYHRIRWNELNGIALCWPDHEYLDTHPAEKRAFVREKFPGRLRELERLKDSAPMPDLAEIIERYGRAA